VRVGGMLRSARGWDSTSDRLVLMGTTFVALEDRRMPLRIVVLTYPCAKTLRLLSSLAESGLAIAAVLLQQSSLSRRIARLVRGLGILDTLTIAMQRLNTELSARPECNPHRAGAYRVGGCRVIKVRDLDSNEVVALLKQLDPDIGVIGCAGILRPEVFHAFRIGVLNIHPGQTPQYRGRSPLEWTILEDAQPGVTLHFVDSGVDTGPVVQQLEVPVEAGDDFESLYGRVYDVGIRLLVSSLERLQQVGSLGLLSQNWRGSHLRYSMPRRLRRAAQRRLHERASTNRD